MAKIEALVKEIMAKGKVPGAAVGLVKDGELVYASGFGVSKLGSNEPVTPDSVFVMGLVAKTLVAMAIGWVIHPGLPNRRAISANRDWKECQRCYISIAALSFW